MRMRYRHPCEEAYTFAIREAQAHLPAQADPAVVASLALTILLFHMHQLPAPSWAVH